MKIAFHIYCVGNSPKVIFFSQYLEVFFTIIDELLFRTTDQLRITCISSQPNTPGWSCKSYYLFSQKTLSKKHIFCICHETKDLWNFGQAWSPHTNSPRWLLSLDRGSSSMSFLQPNTSPCFTYIKKHDNVVNYHEKRFFIHCPNRFFFRQKKINSSKRDLFRFAFSFVGSACFSSLYALYIFYVCRLWY